MGFKVQAKMCATCIYRPDSTLDLKKLENDVRDKYVGFKGHRICHHSTDVCCRGFWNKHKDEFPMGQIAQRLGFVEFVNVDTLASGDEEEQMADETVKVWVYGGDGIYADEHVDEDSKNSDSYEPKTLKASFVVTAEQVTANGDVSLVEFLHRIGALTGVPEQSCAEPGPIHRVWPEAPTGSRSTSRSPTYTASCVIRRPTLTRSASSPSTRRTMRGWRSS